MAKRIKKPVKHDPERSTNPYGVNQYTELDPRQKLCWENYVNPTSKTFANATQSAIAAGYEPDYADQITVATWFKGRVRRMNLLSKAEVVLEETLEVPHVIPIVSMFGPVVNKETNEIYTKVDSGILKIKQDSAKFVASTQGKDVGYSTRTEITGANGKDLVSQEDIEERLKRLRK